MGVLVDSVQKPSKLQTKLLMAVCMVFGPNQKKQFGSVLSTLITNHLVLNDVDEPIGKLAHVA